MTIGHPSLHPAGTSSPFCCSSRTASCSYTWRSSSSSNLPLLFLSNSPASNITLVQGIQNSYLSSSQPCATSCSSQLCHPLAGGYHLLPTALMPTGMAPSYTLILRLQLRVLITSFAFSVFSSYGWEYKYTQAAWAQRVEFFRAKIILIWYFFFFLDPIYIHAAVRTANKND